MDYLDYHIKNTLGLHLKRSDEDTDSMPSLVDQEDQDDNKEDDESSEASEAMPGLADMSANSSVPVKMGIAG